MSLIRLFKPENENGNARIVEPPVDKSWKRLLNAGCGNTFHPAWTNMDLNSGHPEVQQVDIASGLPVDVNSQDAIYHSHVLEHLDVEQGKRFLKECFRALRPGGVLRIVVPDLEQIARLYLNLHDQAWQGNDSSARQYEWIKLELLDQLVRGTSGGQMGRYIARLNDESVSQFVKSRIGVEFGICRLPNESGPSEHQSRSDNPEAGPTNVRPFSRLFEQRRIGSNQSGTGWRFWTARMLTRWIAGKEMAEQLDEARFRASGEVHRWMYDRFSLKQVCVEAGFADFRVCSPTESQIPEFSEYGLDCRDGVVRKPDSLFAECRKPRLAVSPRIDAA